MEYASVKTMARLDKNPVFVFCHAKLGILGDLYYFDFDILSVVETGLTLPSCRNLKCENGYK